MPDILVVKLLTGFEAFIPPVTHGVSIAISDGNAYSCRG